MSLTDQVILVTGASGALGRAVCATFLEADAVVVGADIADGGLSAQMAAATGKQRFSFQALDANDEASVAGLVTKIVAIHSRIDALIHLIGGYQQEGDVGQTSVQTWDAMQQMNARTAFLMMHHVFPIMKKQKGGRIVTVGARPALSPAAGSSAYGAAKATLIHLTKTVAEEGRDFGITANSVLPGIMDTPANRAAMPDADVSAWVTTEHVSRVMLFLVGAQGAATSGATIPVYGRA